MRGSEESCGSHSSSYGGPCDRGPLTMGDTLIEQTAGGTGDPTRERVTRLFQFVAALYERRNPAIRQMSEHEWILRLAEVPAHQTINLVTSVGEEPELEEQSAETEVRPLL